MLPACKSIYAGEAGNKYQDGEHHPNLALIGLLLQFDALQLCLFVYDFQALFLRFGFFQFDGSLLLFQL